MQIRTIPPPCEVSLQGSLFLVSMQVHHILRANAHGVLGYSLLSA